jgi:hypothetical protein
MSAWVVAKAHIDAMINTAVALYADRNHELCWMHDGVLRKLTDDELNRVGQMLVDENVRSVIGRYPDTLHGGDIPGPVDPYYARPYILQESERDVPAVELLKLIDCYEHQACEHDEWKTSEACTFCDDLRCAAIMKLRGYQAAPWGWKD